MSTDLEPEVEGARLIGAVHANLGDLRTASPLVYGPEPSGRVVALRENDEVRSACAVLPRELLIGGLHVRTGFLGNVTTHPDHRGSGHASRLLEQVESDLAAAGCVLSLLWADDPAFYARRGYTPIGTEVDAALDRELASSLPAADNVRPATLADAARIHTLYLHHRERTNRSAEETQTLLELSETTTLVKEVGGEVIAYACLGRGADLRNVIHEWAGLPQDVLGVVRAMLEDPSSSTLPGGQLFFMLPPSADRLVADLEELGANTARGILGLAKVVDPSAAAELLAEALRSVPGLRIDAGGNETVLVTTKGATALHVDELARLLFGPRGDRALHEEVEAEIGVPLTGLPLTPFVWGLDSI